MTEQKEIAALKARIERLETVNGAMKTTLWYLKGFMEVCGDFMRENKSTYSTDYFQIIERVIKASGTQREFEAALDAAQSELEKAGWR